MYILLLSPYNSEKDWMEMITRRFKILDQGHKFNKQ